jgi:glycosyltransferase involved in cell wall biosynthesis
MKRTKPKTDWLQNISDIAAILLADQRTNRVVGRDKSVLHLLPSFGWGGAERMACTIHRLAQQRGYRSSLLSLPIASIEQGLYEEGLRDGPPSRAAPGDTLHRGEQWQQTLLRQWVRVARQRVLELSPSVVHAHLAYPDRFGAVASIARGFCKVISFQLLPGQHSWWSQDELFGWRSDNVLRRLGSRLRDIAFVAPSDDDVLRVGELVAPRGVTKVKNCPALPRVNLERREPFAWTPDVVRLLSVGRLVEHKGFVSMLEALAQPHTRELQWQWVIAGDGPERERLLRRAAELQIDRKISLQGALPGQSLYGTADIVLCPSEQEGYPLVPLEAVEAGAAVLLSPIAAHCEQFATVTESLLSPDRSLWSAELARFINAKELRETLARTQKQRLPSDPRGETIDGYVRLYESFA